MRTLFTCLCLAVITGLSATQNAVAAQPTSPDNQWQVVEIKGEVSIKLDSADDWSAATQGGRVEAPFYIRTGNDSRVVLSHRKDEITVASNSVIKLEAERESPQGIVSKIIQSVGYSIFKIEKNSGRQNIIETPYLVSVVKGTTFTVHSDLTRATVNLIEGRLEVRLPSQSAGRIITTGQIALYSKGDNGISVIDIMGNVNKTANASANPPRNANAEQNNSNNENRLNKGQSSANGHVVPANSHGINATIKDTVRSVNGNANANIPTMPGPGRGNGPGNVPGNVPGNGNPGN